MRVRAAEDAEAHGGAADENDGADAVGVPAAADEMIDQPAADGEIGCGGDEPGHAGVEERRGQVDVERAGEIDGQPGEQQIEDVVVRAEADGEADDLGLSQQIAESGMHLACRGRTVRWSR